MVYGAIGPRCRATSDVDDNGHYHLCTAPVRHSYAEHYCGACQEWFTRQPKASTG